MQIDPKSTSPDQQSNTSRKIDDVDQKKDRSYSLLRLIGKLIPPFVFRVKALYVLMLPRKRWQLQTTIPGLKWATKEDIEQLDRLGHQPPTAKIRFETGSRAVIREEDGQLTGCIWFDSVASACDGWLQIVLPSSSLWISDVFVSPEYRGKGIANQMGNYARAELAKYDITNLVTVTNALNHPAVRSSKKAQYKTTYIWYVRLFGLTCARFPCRWRIGWWGLGRLLEVPLSELQKTEGT